MIERKIKIGQVQPIGKKLIELQMEETEERQLQEQAAAVQAKTIGGEESTFPSEVQPQPQKLKLKPKARKTIFPVPIANTEAKREGEGSAELPLFLKPSDNDKPVRITTYIEKEVYENLRKLKEEYKIKSITTFVNTSVKEYLKKYNLL